MSNLIFIEPRGGLTTGERLLQVIDQYPQGCTIKHLSKTINRPVSMINLCLKQLTSSKQITIQLSGMQRLIYPKG
jgi:DNA-binding IclR family transcriptional regulator